MTLHYEISGSGQPVILLHGMVGSSRYWKRFIAHRQNEYQYIAIDLLGFGKSPKPRSGRYDYSAHIEAILDTLKELDITDPVPIIAHSMGALLALRLAADHPDAVSSLVLCGLPYYPDPETARMDLTKSSRLRELAYYGPTSHALCTLWCRWLRPVTKYLAPLYLRQVTPEVAQDSLLHTWQSYSQSLECIISRQQVADDVARLTQPAILLYGDQDGCAQYFAGSGIAKASSIDLRIIPGLTHQLPLEQPALILDALQTLQRF